MYKKYVKNMKILFILLVFMWSEKRSALAAQGGANKCSFTGRIKSVSHSVNPAGARLKELVYYNTPTSSETKCCYTFSMLTTSLPR